MHKGDALCSEGDVRCYRLLAHPVFGGFFPGVGGLPGHEWRRAHRRDLFAQHLGLLLPVRGTAEPRKRRREGRIVPSLGQPGAVVNPVNPDLGNTSPTTGTVLVGTTRNYLILDPTFTHLLTPLSSIGVATEYQRMDWSPANTSGHASLSSRGTWASTKMSCSFRVPRPPTGRAATRAE